MKEYAKTIQVSKMYLKEDLSQTTLACRTSAAASTMAGSTVVECYGFVLPSMSLGRTTTVGSNGCNSHHAFFGSEMSFVVAGKGYNAYQKMNGSDLTSVSIGFNGIAPTRCSCPHVVGIVLTVARLSDTFLVFYIVLQRTQ